MNTDLAVYNHSYQPERNAVTRIAWYIINSLFFKSSFPVQRIKRILLRQFGATLGKNVVLKPGVNIKYPWNISVGNNSWIGEEVWLDSLGRIEIGDNCCLSQGAKIITGNHNYKSPSFDLIVNNIMLENGVWLGCGAIVCGQTICKKESVVTAGSVASGILDAYGIYKGNPAVKTGERVQDQLKAII